jgi:hypothetical protein
MIDVVVSLWRLENPGKKITMHSGMATLIGAGWWKVEVTVSPEGEEQQRYAFEYNPQADELRLASRAARVLFTDIMQVSSH